MESEDDGKVYYINIEDKPVDSNNIAEATRLNSVLSKVYGFRSMDGRVMCRITR